MMIYRLFFKYLSIVLIVFIIAGETGFAQKPLWGKGTKIENPGLFLEFARFKSDQPEKTRLEIYFQIFNSSLEFTKIDSLWVAKYEVIAIVREDNEQVDAYNKIKRIHLSDSSKTKSNFDYRTSQINFDLDPGKYKVEFSIRDIRSKKVINHDFEIKCEHFDSKWPMLSDVEFIQSANKADDTASVFLKGELQLIPSVTKTFGGENDNRLLYYMEVYEGSSEKETEHLLVETRLRHQSKGMVYRDTLYTELIDGSARQLRQISLDEFPPGRYSIEIFLRGRRNKQLARSEFDFEILWNQEALVKFDWDKVVKQLSYIAESGELDNFDKLKTMEEKQMAFNEFWLKRDPTSGTLENEAKREFYIRVNIANNRFSVLKREGWRTDRGMIFIKYGEPDEIDDVPFASGSAPYQIWHYFSTGRYLRFVFIDEKSDGEYRLQYPYDGLYQTPDF